MACTMCKLALHYAIAPVGDDRVMLGVLGLEVQTGITDFCLPVIISWKIEIWLMQCLNLFFFQTCLCHQLDSVIIFAGISRADPVWDLL